MNNNQFSPNAISHKELNSLLNQARKENTSIDINEDPENQDNQEFNNLITNWTETSQKILLMLKQKEKFISKNKSPKSLIAFGAMGAHINMALEALKATESDQ